MTISPEELEQRKVDHESQPSLKWVSGCHRCNQEHPCDVMALIEALEASQAVLYKWENHDCDAEAHYENKALRAQLATVVDAARPLRRWAEWGEHPPPAQLAAFDAAIAALGERADEGGTDPASERETV